MLPTPTPLHSTSANDILRLHLVVAVRVSCVSGVEILFTDLLRPKRVVITFE